MVQTKLASSAATQSLKPIAAIEDHFERLQESSRKTLSEIWRAMPKDVLKCSEGMAYGEQRKYLAWEIDPRKVKANHIEIIQITDVQFGHVCCKYDRLVEYRDWILSMPNRFVVLTGDMIDAWAAWSPGRPFEQLFDPLSQVIRFAETFAPLRHRILGNVGGNHERRAIPGFGDLGSLLATVLKIPYSNGRQLIDIYYGKHNPFRLTIWHGIGGAQTKGGIAQRLDRFAQQGDSQVYLMGHLHQGQVIYGWKEVREERQHRIKLRKFVAAIGTSFLDTWGTYGEVAGFNPTDVVMPRVVIEPDGHWELTLK